MLSALLDDFLIAPETLSVTKWLQINTQTKVRLQAQKIVTLMQPGLALQPDGSPTVSIANKVRSMVNNDYAYPDLFDLLYTRPTSGTGPGEYHPDDSSLFLRRQPKTIPEGLQAQINSIHSIDHSPALSQSFSLTTLKKFSTRLSLACFLKSIVLTSQLTPHCSCGTMTGE